ncbi:MAG: DUF448 domain-containing protein [Marinomonas sp.]
MRTPTNESVGSDTADAPRLSKNAQPERKCILSGEAGPRDILVRLAISPEDADGRCTILPDAQAKAPGRGAWLGVSRGELETAMAKGHLKGALARSFKSGAIDVPDDLPALIASALEGAFKDGLGLAKRAGHVVLGTAKIEDQLRKGRAELLLHASDSSQDGRKKLDQAWRVGREIEGSGERGAVLPLDRAALSVALGRENVVHLALINRGGAQRIASAIARLQHFVGPQDAANEQAKTEDGAQQLAGAAEECPAR